MGLTAQLWKPVPQVLLLSHSDARQGPSPVFAHLSALVASSLRGARSAGRPGTSRPSAGRPPAVVPGLPASGFAPGMAPWPPSPGTPPGSSSKQSAATSRMALETLLTLQKARSRATKFCGSSAREPHHLSAMATCRPLKGGAALRSGPCSCHGLFFHGSKC